jgi:hypothetical protein
MTDEEIIDGYYNDWYLISRHKYLSEEFIKKHSDKVYWENISAYQKLSEEFIEEFSDKLFWRLVDIQNKFSEKFVKKFINKLNMKYIPLCCFKINDKQSWRTFL